MPVSRMKTRVRDPHASNRYQTWGLRDSRSVFWHKGPLRRLSNRGCGQQGSKVRAALTYNYASVRGKQHTQRPGRMHDCMTAHECAGPARSGMPARCVTDNPPLSSTQLTPVKEGKRKENYRVPKLKGDWRASSSGACSLHAYLWAPPIRQDLMRKMREMF
jgi:hypothetical protein